MTPFYVYRIASKTLPPVWNIHMCRALHICWNWVGVSVFFWIAYHLLAVLVSCALPLGDVLLCCRVIVSFKTVAPSDLIQFNPNMYCLLALAQQQIMNANNADEYGLQNLSCSMWFCCHVHQTYRCILLVEQVVIDSDPTDNICPNFPLLLIRERLHRLPDLDRQVISQAAR